MVDNKQYPQNPNEIVLNKIVWKFWQSSYAYYINNEYVCLFTYDQKAVNDNGTPINELDSMNVIHRAFGTFSLYKIFRMFDGNYGIDKLRPLKTITAISNDKCKSLDEFIQSGIFECLNSYLTSNK